MEKRASSREQTKVVAREGGSKTPGGGLLSVGGKWDWAKVLHSACAFLGISFLFFFPEEEGLRKGHAGHSSGLPYLGGQLLAGCSWEAGRSLLPALL